MVQFIWNKKTNQVMPKTTWALYEFVNDDVISADAALNMIPAGTRGYDMDSCLLNKWFDIADTFMMKQMKFINAEHDEIM